MAESACIGPANTKQSIRATATDPSSAIGITSNKRKATTELTRDHVDGANSNVLPGSHEQQDAVAPVSDQDALQELPAGAGEQAHSKSALKRQRHQKRLQTVKLERKHKRKEKRQRRSESRRADLEARITDLAASQNIDLHEARSQVLAADAESKPSSRAIRKERAVAEATVPVTLILDCAFEDKMLENEIVSLSSQVVRSYSVNRRGINRAHLCVSSFGGQMKARFETLMNGCHVKWRGVYISESDFVEAAQTMRDIMVNGPTATNRVDLIRSPSPSPDLQKDVDHPSIVYLTSDSPHTLSRLEANTCYVIGGLVDRNREKGLCYRRALDRRVRTAKLPIGEYMAMQSRYVLTTNQVVEIMVRWLDCGDWGKAFVAIIPKRKGGSLKDGIETDKEAVNNGTARQGPTSGEKAAPPKNPSEPSQGDGHTRKKE